MISEQERNESKHRQAQGIKVAKEKGVSISKIAQEVNITRQTVYRIKDSKR